MQLRKVDILWCTCRDVEQSQEGYVILNEYVVNNAYKSMDLAAEPKREYGGKYGE